MKSNRNILKEKKEVNYCGECIFFKNSPRKLGISINPEENSANIIEMNSYSCKEVGRVEKDIVCSTFLSPKKL